MAKISPELANELEFYKTIKTPQLFRLVIKPDYLHSFSGKGGLVLISLLVLYGLFFSLLSWQGAVCCFALGFFLYAAFFSHKITIADGILTYKKYFLLKEEIPGSSPPA